MSQLLSKGSGSAGLPQRVPHWQQSGEEGAFRVLGYCLQWAQASKWRDYKVDLREDTGGRKRAGRFCGSGKGCPGSGARSPQAGILPPLALLTV